MSEGEPDKSLSPSDKAAGQNVMEGIHRKSYSEAVIEGPGRESRVLPLSSVIDWESPSSPWSRRHTTQGAASFPESFSYDERNVKVTFGDNESSWSVLGWRSVVLLLFCVIALIALVLVVILYTKTDAILGTQ
ncbi:hypothetical protein LSAT2_022029 [Lamellibrachia satsuma]|nr:hypothetical protein LSAT2_022029 [Lamellibrachia satsuma]